MNPRADPASIGAPRAVITLATGPVVYWNMAVNLARSIRRWHTADDLPITIATDYEGSPPRDLQGISVLKLKPGELGKGFQTKLHLDRLAPAPRTMFIDADCLIYARLDGIFERLRGRPVATIGKTITDGEWFGDVRSYCQNLGVEGIPQFNGGLYYLESSEMASRVFQRARDLVKDYDKLGRVRLRGLPNEELLVSAAMALEGLTAAPDDGSVMSDPQSCPGPMSTNILVGWRQLENPLPPSPLHRPVYPFHIVSPTIVHFLGDHTRRPAYRTDAARLRLVARGLPAPLAEGIARLTIWLPQTLLNQSKNFFRPLYRRLFGARAVPKSERMA